MSIAKSIEISADSTSSFEDALQQGIKSASDKLENVKSVWIKGQQAEVEHGAVKTYRVWLKVTFQLK